MVKTEESQVYGKKQFEKELAEVESSRKKALRDIAEYEKASRDEYQEIAELQKKLKAALGKK